MKKVEQILKYIALSLIILAIMLLVNIVILFVMTVNTNNGDAYFPIESFAQEMDISDTQDITITQKGICLLDKYEGFAMVLDNNGNIIWNYRLPSELNRKYSLQDVAVFSRWYLEGHPVTCWAEEEELLVVGTKKHSVWKYSIAYTMTTMNVYIKYIPLILFFDICVVIGLPAYILRRQNKKREHERTEWIAGVSHDIRTPLALVIGYADELKCKPNEEDIEKFAEKIEKESIKIKRLVTNLNTENKMSYGMVKWKKEQICFAALLREILCDFINNNMDELYDFDVEIDERTEQRFILGDKELLRRMIENLLNNAVEHNKNGCLIKVNLSYAKKNQMFFSISDDGCGMSKILLKEICKTNKNNRLPERGLGLHLVYKIAKKHKIKIRFMSSEGEGMCCEMRLKNSF